MNPERIVEDDELSSISSDSDRCSITEHCYLTLTQMINQIKTLPAESANRILTNSTKEMLCDIDEKMKMWRETGIDDDGTLFGDISAMSRILKETVEREERAVASKNTICDSFKPSEKLYRLEGMLYICVGAVLLIFLQDNFVLRLLSYRISSL